MAAFPSIIIFLNELFWFEFFWCLACELEIYVIDTCNMRSFSRCAVICYLPCRRETKNLHAKCNLCAHWCQSCVIFYFDSCQNIKQCNLDSIFVPKLHSLTRLENISTSCQYKEWYFIRWRRFPNRLTYSRSKRNYLRIEKCGKTLKTNVQFLSLTSFSEHFSIFQIYFKEKLRAFTSFKGTYRDWSIPFLVLKHLVCILFTFHWPCHYETLHVILKI